MSDRSDSDVRLPRAAEALLARWPVTEKDERAWEESAEAILVRVEMARAGATDDALLAPPLPSEMGEGSIQSTRSAPRAKRSSAPTSAPVSLAALARAALAEEQAASSAEPARVSPIPARVSPLPAHVTPLPAHVTPLPAPVSEPTPLSALPPVSAVPPAPPPSVALQQAPAVKRSKVAPLFAVGIAVIGIAAAVMLVIRTQKARETEVASAPLPAVDHEPAPAAAPPPPAATTTDLEIETPESLAPAKPGAAAPAPRPMAKAAPAPAEEQGGKTAAAEPPEQPAAPPPPPSAQQEQDSDKMKPAAQPTDLPLQPSSGAVQAAVAQVIGSARACVAGHEAPSHASIVFGADGRVQSVAVSGPAAGTPAEACIRSALSRARVAPFSKPTFSVGTAVRP